MFNIHLNAGAEKDALIEEIKNRFERIYEAISSIEYKINEDDVLTYTLRVYFNSLWETNALDKIDKELEKSDCLSFIRAFTYSLAESFDHLSIFFGEDERDHMPVHSLISLGGIGISLPFILKAYKFGLSKKELNNLCSGFETLVLRHRLIGTRADITSRLNDVYQKFTSDAPSISPILSRINYLKRAETDSWWGYWNNEELKRAIQGEVKHSSARYILWRYEHFLASESNKGYGTLRFNGTLSPELEHIAPQTENPDSGYDTYDEEFRHQYINCLGNFLLLSKTHNCTIGNKPFEVKRGTYLELKQQREIQKLTADKPVWTKEHIQKRKDRIVTFVLDTF